MVPCMHIKVVDKTPDMVHANGDRSCMHSLSIHRIRMTIGEARGIHNAMKSLHVVVFSKHPLPVGILHSQRQATAVSLRLQGLDDDGPRLLLPWADNGDQQGRPAGAEERMIWAGLMG